MHEHEKNPAGRLYLFLEYMNTHGGPNQGSFPIVAQYFDAEQFSPRMYAGQALLSAQPALMKENVEALSNPPIPASSLLADHGRVETAIAGIGNPSQTIVGFRAEYDVGVMKSLEHTSHILNNASITHGNPESSIQAIREAAEALKTAVLDDTTLDATVRRILFDHVDAILRSLDFVKLGGTELVLSEFDRMYGHLRREPELATKISRRPKVLKALLALGQVLNAFAAFINGGLALEAGFEQWLSVDSSVEAPADPGEGSTAA